jgi:branched-chain amino acid transport system permease protein
MTVTTESTLPEPALPEAALPPTVAEKLGSKRNWVKIAGTALFVYLVLVLPHLRFTENSDGILPIFTVVLCAVYALFSLGLNIVVGFAGLLDLGYVAFFLVGAYVSAWFMSGFFYKQRLFFLDGLTAFEGEPKVAGVHITFWLVVLLAGLVAAVAGVIIGAPTLRLKSDYLALVTLGFGEILPEVFRNAEPITNGTKGIGPVDPIGTGFLHKIPFDKPISWILKIVPSGWRSETSWAGFEKRIGPSDYTAKYYVIMIFCILFVWISIRLRDGRLGRAWMAIREDELAASLMGVPLMRTKLWSYAVGAFAGGIGGAFYATIVGTVNVDNFTFAFSIIILCAVILGGMGNIWGAIVGGVVITWFNYSGLKFFGAKFNSGVLNCSADAISAGKVCTHIDLERYNFGFFGLVLVLMMLFRPQGLIPAARSRAVKKSEAVVEGVDA